MTITKKEIQEMEEDANFAWELTMQVFEDCADGHDQVTTAFGVWVNLIHFLVECGGYTKEELMRDLEWHVENQSAKGFA